MRKCCICDGEIYFGFNYLCKSCWDVWKDQIHEPWLKFLMLQEQKERTFNINYSNIISFEEIQEIEYND